MLIEDSTLKEAKSWLRARAENGTKCPCCNQFVKFYKRPILQCMASCLITMFKNFNDGKFHHISDLNNVNKNFSSNGGAFSLTRFWGLTQEQVKKDEKKTRTSGYWKLTNNGSLFVRRKLSVPKRGCFYDGKLLKWVDETDLVTIDQCFKNEFDYEKLIKGSL